MDPKHMGTIMLFGDSLTQRSWELGGLGARLADAYVRKLDVVNRGYDGYNSEWAIPVFEKVFAKKSEREHAPDVPLLIIWLGANDAVVPGENQHVPLEKFVINMKHLIALVRSPESEYYSPDTRILLINPPPVNTYQRGDFLASANIRDKERDREFEVTRLYAEAVIELAREEGVPVTDVWTLLWEAAGKDERALGEYLLDGVHLNAKGYKFVYSAVSKSIKEAYPETHHDVLPYVIPQRTTLSWWQL
jgi:lysophospholipase L1-like esterase